MPFLPRMVLLSSCLEPELNSAEHILEAPSNKLSSLWRPVEGAGVSDLELTAIAILEPTLDA